MPWPPNASAVGKVWRWPWSGNNPASLCRILSAQRVSAHAGRPTPTLDSLFERQRGTLPDTFGARPLTLAEGRMTMELTIEPWMMAPNGFLHAATQVMLADTCAGYATLAHLPEGAKGFTTLELKSNFLGTAKQGILHVEAVAEHLGRTTQVWSATLFDDKGRRLSLFRCSQIVLW